MKLTFLLFAVLCGFAIAQDDLGFPEWKSFHGKQYRTTQEEAYRFSVYQRSLKIIETHNSQNHSYKLGLNAIADLTLKEFTASRLGLLAPVTSRRLRRRILDLSSDSDGQLMEAAPVDLTVVGDGAASNRRLAVSPTPSKSHSSTRSISTTRTASKSISISRTSTKSISTSKSPTHTPSSSHSPSKSGTPTRSPSKSISLTPSVTLSISITPSVAPTPPDTQGGWDWTNMAGVTYVTPIKNQGHCGDCYTFSAAEAIESVNAINGNGLVTLSEQQLVDCSHTAGNNGCNGGWMDYVFDYVIASGGICLESEYPYTSGANGAVGSCQASSCSTKVPIRSYVDVTPNDDAALERAIIQQPVSVAIFAATSSFQLYQSGVFTASCTGRLDHAVIAYGFGTDPVTGLPFYRIRNQWGTSWGMAGYMWMLRDPTVNNGAGQCNILSKPSYPVQ